MFGESEDGIKSSGSGGASGGIRGGPDRGRMDNQLISPVGAMNMPSDQKKIPTW